MATATLTWTLPTTRTDGSRLDPSQIANITILDGAENIGDASGTATTFMTGPLAAGVHNFTVVVVDVEGNHSAPSNAASVTVELPLTPPSPVTDLAASLNP